MCDNCQDVRPVREHDMTDPALQMLALLEQMQEQARGAKLTLKVLTEAFRGNNNAQIRKVGADRAHLYAAGKALPRDLVETMTQQMLLQSYLREEAHDAGAGFMADYVFHGQRCPELRSGRQRLIVKTRGPGVAEGKAAGGGGASEEKKKKKRRKKEKAGAPAAVGGSVATALPIEDDIDDEDDDEADGGGGGGGGATLQAVLSHSRKQQQQTGGPSRIPPQHQQDLRRMLREVRERKAREKGISDYIVFSSETISTMVQRVPVTVEEFSEIEGIGLKKTQEYGDEVVKLICEFLTRHGLLEKIAGGAMPAAALGASADSNESDDKDDFVVKKSKRA